ncbi:unnamed protein product [Ascophyllum nodosum]
MSFLPICNVCLLEIGSGTQGILLSCGHFVCHGCCGASETAICPHCGSRARAASLDHPPAEVRDYLQNPLTQFRASSDVVKFQLDHFRSAAKQACKALHELRLLYSREVKRREAAEQEAEEFRLRAARAKNLEKGGRENVSLDGGGGSFATAFGEGRARAERSEGTSASFDSNSPIGKLRQRFLGVRSQEPDEKSPVFRTSRVVRHDRLGREGVSEGPTQQATREPGRGAAVTGSAQSGGRARPSMSFSGPPPTARYIVQGNGTKPTTPRATSGPPPDEPLRERHAGSGEQRSRQQVTSMVQRPETPGRPIRPAWQDTGRMRLGAERVGGGAQQLTRPSTPRHGQMRLPQARQQQPQSQTGGLQARAGMEEIRRQTCGQNAAIDCGERTGYFPAVGARDPRGSTSGSFPSTGLGRPSSSPRSPLLGGGGSLKRPSSGGLPSPKRSGFSTAAELPGSGTRQGRAGTPLTPLTPLRACPPSPRLRSPQLPFTPRSMPRPGSGRRPSSTGSSQEVGRFDGACGPGKPSTPAGDHHAKSLPQSLAAAGLFTVQGRR